jgi:hypothetical protein
MDANMEELARKGQQSLLSLNELSQHAALIGNLGALYNEPYANKADYRAKEDPECGYNLVMKCFKRPRQFYKMFWMSTAIFIALHDLLVSSYGLTSSRNVTSIESLAIFLWIVGGSQSFSQAENRFVRYTWTIHIKFKEVLKSLLKLANHNIKLKDRTFSNEHEKLKEHRFWPHFKGAIGAMDETHIPVVVPVDEVINYTCRHRYTSQNVLAICDFDMRFTFVVAGWAGSADDTRILNHALANFPSFPIPLKGK